MNDRYSRYRGMIGEAFYDGRCPGDISESSGTGDKHLHGDAVTRIKTSDGITIYYKPRDCRSSDLLGEINELVLGKKMVPEQICGDGFAFQKEIVKKIPETSGERTAYYRDLGRLTAVFYALGSSDMHLDNVLSTENGPVVVDTETVLCPKAKGVGGTGEYSVDYGEIFPDYLTSVGECMVLPRFFAMMQMSPMILSRDWRPEPYTEAFVEGFTEGYGNICDKRVEVGQLLDGFADIPLRYLLRSTQSYAMKIWRYQNAKSEEDRQNVIKSLEKGLSKTDIDHWRPVIEWETECIKEGDIPYFWLTAGGTALMGDINREPLISDYLILSPVDYAKWRINRMCDRDLEVQISYIRASLKHIDGWEKARETDDLIPDEPLSAEDAVSEAKEALIALRDERIPLSGGCCLWHTPLINGRVGCLFGVGEGFSGVALFAKACADSDLIIGEFSKIAEDLTRACFNDMACFCEHLLNEYPVPPEGRAISRRYNGGFDLKDGLKGTLWALDLLRDEDPDRTLRILEGFKDWDIGYDRASVFDEFADAIVEGKNTDSIEGGRCAKALKLLINGSGDDGSIREAGRILKAVCDYKKRYGAFKVYVNGRRQYFLPAFLRGTTGICYTLLRYAQQVTETCNDDG